MPGTWSFGTPAAEFTRAFHRSFYFDVSEELAPFGSDEGYDEIANWYDRRHELTQCTTVREMLRSDDAEDLFGAMTAAPDIDAIYMGYAFSLLYFTGHIDAEGKKYLLVALRDTTAYYGDENLQPTKTIIADVTAFAATDCGS